MKKLAFITSISCFAMAMLSCHDDKRQQEDSNEIFSKGEKITNKNFTGDVWLNNLAQADSINQNAVGSVTFAPGARTNGTVTLQDKLYSLLTELDIIRKKEVQRLLSIEEM